MTAGTELRVPLERGAGWLACPACQTPFSDGDLGCGGCGAAYALRDGIPAFCDGDGFYDDYLQEHCPFVRSPGSAKAALLRVLPYWSWREWKFFRSHLRRGASVLDIGCAHGKEWFTERAGFIAGVDLSLLALVECAQHYDVVARADIERLPFRSASFDCVVTSHVLGHVAPEKKDAALAEIARVLAPGGLSLNVVETDSIHPFVERAKRDPELYRANFVETDGHVGLELPSAVLARFRRHGFAMVDVRKMESGPIHLRYYGKYAGRGYPERDRRVRRAIARWERLERHAVPLALYEVAMGLYHAAIEPWRTPIDRAMFLAIAAEKPPIPAARNRRATVATRKHRTDLKPRGT